jgi:UDP-N-acetylmuramoyl-L-alanyl-D-glutamate--2,6-diaminopimelate ligase
MKSIVDIEHSSKVGSAPLAEGSRASTVKLTELLRLIPLQTVEGPKDLAVSGVTLDSRDVRPGYVFVACEGEKTDGHRFIDDAIASGAVVIVSERAPATDAATWVQTPDARKAAGLLAAKAVGEPSRHMDLIGVTGTNGKTTTAFLIDGLLSRLAPPTAMMGTVVAKIGNRSWATRHTTPEAPVLQSFLANALAGGCRYGVLEVSSHGLSLSRLEGSEFQVAVFTSLSRDHLDFHKDMEDYFRAKKLLFNRYARSNASAVVCIDDTYGERLAAELGGKVTTYGFSSTADLSIVQADASLEGIHLRFREGDRVRKLESSLMGHYNAANLLAAYAVVRALEFSTEEILGALSAVRGAPGRFEKVDVDRPFDVIVDYAHTDDALRKLLQAARPLTRGSLTVVFGCGGERDRTKRPLMGDVASRLADRVVLTSDNPRGEDPVAILKEIQLGTQGASVSVEPDRRKAIALALAGAGPGDLVVIAGKGHEPYQIVGTEVHAFDDREVVRELLGSGEETTQ